VQTRSDAALTLLQRQVSTTLLDAFVTVSVILVADINVPTQYSKLLATQGAGVMKLKYVSELSCSVVVIGLCCCIKYTGF